MARNWAGSPDSLNANGVLIPIANDTVGTVMFWVCLNSDTGTLDIISSMRRAADAKLTDMFISANWSVSNNYLDFWCRLDNTMNWRYRTAVGSLTTYIGEWLHVAITQNATAPVCYFNGVSQSLTVITSVNTTKWFKAAITDAASPSDTFYLGQSGASTNYMNSKLESFGIWDVVLSEDEIKAAARGVHHRRIRPLSGKVLMPLWGIHSPEIDLTPNAITGTLTGTTRAATAAPVSSNWLSVSWSVPLIEVAVAAVAKRNFYHMYNRTAVYGGRS